jgi:hypothetical protein
MNYRRASFVGALILSLVAGGCALVLANSTDRDTVRSVPVSQASQTESTKSSLPAKMPDGTNTGVPPGTALSEYTGPMSIDTANTVIDGKIIRGALVIRAKDVRITRSQIIGTVSNDEHSVDTSFTIADSLVEAGDKLQTGISSRDFVATRVHVIGGNRSILCFRNCVVEYSYVHGQMTDESGKAHESGIRMSQGSTIRFNTIACDAPDIPPDAGCSAALTGYGDFEPVQNNLIEGNVFVHGSGGFCAYGGSSGANGAKPFGAEAANIRFINNVWQRGTSPGDKGVPVCGHWGPITDFNSSRPGNVWSGNKWDDGTQLNP